MARTGRLTESQQAALDAVANHLPEGSVVVALSGGADSACLAWAVVQLGVQARAVSIDHGLAGSARLMAAASQIASMLDMDHEVVPVEATGTSETALRDVRLVALEAAAGPEETVLTGHTADDQAETVLGNLVRGAGPVGLAGIPQRRGVFARPLLGMRREVVRRVAAESGLPFVDDPENFDPTIRRNTLRSVTLPHLADTYNPAAIDAIVRAAELIGADDAELEARAAKVPVVRDEEAVLVPASTLLTVPRPIASRVVRRALRLVGGPHAGDADDIDAVLATAATSTTASLSGGLQVSRERAHIAIYPIGVVAVPEPVRLQPNDETRFGRWVIRSGGQTLSPLSAQVVLGTQATVRAPRPGDRIAIGGGRHKTVADALSESRVPQRLRARWPLVDSDDTILWIVGVRAAPTDGPTQQLAAHREVR